MEPTLVRDGGRLALKTDGDPAYGEPVFGWDLFACAVDLGIARDPSGLAIINSRCEPAIGDRGFYLKEPHLTVLRCERLPSMQYTDLATMVENVLNQPMLKDRTSLAIDAGGPGRAFSSMLDERGIDHMRIQLHGGNQHTRDIQDGLRFENVSKYLAVSNVNSDLFTGKLQIADLGPDKVRALKNELESVEVSVSPVGRHVVKQGDKTHHADALMALVFAHYLVTHKDFGVHYGQRRLAGMF